MKKKVENISELNSYYGELTGLYWVWKNKLSSMKKDDLIGIVITENLFK